MLGHHNLDFRVVIQGIEHIEVALARYAEHAVNAVYA
jgi:hypothetical protein